MLVRLDIWEKGNISLLQLSEKLRGALRHALCDAVMEFLVLPAPLCVEASCPLSAPDLEELSSAGEIWGGMGASSCPQALLLLPEGAWSCWRRALLPLSLVQCPTIEVVLEEIFRVNQLC